MNRDNLKRWNDTRLLLEADLRRARRAHKQALRMLELCPASEETLSASDLIYA